MRDGFETLLFVGLNKNGEVDFGVKDIDRNLSFEEIQEIRAMIPVAIKVLEESVFAHHLNQGEMQGCKIG